MKSWSREERGGFLWGDIIIEGTGDYSDHEMKIWYKNEFLISWLDGKPYVTCPDLICIVDAKTSRGLSNWVEDIRENIGREVVVVGIKCDEIWRTDKGVELFGPRHFDFNIDYKPIELLVR